MMVEMNYLVDITDIFLKNFWKKISILPYPVRKYFAKSIELFPINFINNFKGIFNL